MNDKDNTVSIATNKLDFQLLKSSIGCVNNTEYHGKAPGTLLLIHAEVGYPNTKLVFRYNTMGWNSVFNYHTGEYKEVRTLDTGQPIYQSVDFSTLVPNEK